jgi:tRNA (cmo5U34)-methyltransferase
MRDRVYADPAGTSGPFVFSDEVAKVFPDMLARSVPGYATTLRLIRDIADRVVAPGSRIYDLGCSLGSVSIEIADRIGSRAEIVAVDNAPSMINRLRERVRADALPIRPVLADVRDIRFENAALTVLNFTLQFVPVPDRLSLLRAIAGATRPGGALVLSEKIRFEDERIQADMTALHEGFKKANGYSDLEISRKRAALENVLVPETLDLHRERLLAAGFQRCGVWFQCFNFVSILAFR